MGLLILDQETRDEQVFTDVHWNRSGIQCMCFRDSMSWFPACWALGFQNTRALTLLPLTTRIRVAARRWHCWAIWSYQHTTHNLPSLWQEDAAPASTEYVQQNVWCYAFEKKNGTWVKSVSVSLLFHYLFFCFVLLLFFLFIGVPWKQNIPLALFFLDMSYSKQSPVRGKTFFLNSFLVKSKHQI